MKKLTKKGKIIALVSALALVCVTSGVAMYATGVLPSQSQGDSDDYCSSNLYECLDEDCECHDVESITQIENCRACDKCRGKLIKIYRPAPFG